MQSPPTRLESSASEVLESFNQSSEKYFASCEQRIRRAPVASVLGAAAIGYLLRFIPLGLLFGTLVRLLLILVKPILLLVGGYRLYEFFRHAPTGSANDSV